MTFFGDDTQHQAASGTADEARRQRRALGGQLDEQTGYMQRIARGEESLSAEQLRAALGQTMSQQRSLAASASPQDSTMAALNASRQAMTLGSGLAGAQAQAGIMERQQAQNALLEALLRRRQQEQDAMMQSRQLAAQTQPPGFLDRFGGAIKGAASIAAMA